MKNRSEFKTQKEFYEYLIKNKRELIEFKRAATKITDTLRMDSGKSSVVKSLSTSYKDDVATGAITRSIIANTYMWMDSHKDVHLKNVFSRSITESQDRIWHLHDHIYQTTAKVGKPKSIYEKSILWKDLGVDKSGSTMCLMIDSEIMKAWNPVVFDQYLNGEVDQHSVGMIYRQIDLAVNDPDMKEEFAVFSKYIDDIGNKEEVLQDGYFWAVKEALLKEFSCVLEGSNELTPTVENESKGKSIGEDINEEIENECESLADKVVNEFMKTEEEDFYTKLSKALAQ